MKNARMESSITTVCHGLAAQGGVPPYQKAILPDEDLADIHAYLQSIPKPPDYKSIPLLNP